jgi:diguanylate cyclase (GGDEF)-like protein
MKEFQILLIDESMEDANLIKKYLNRIDQIEFRLTHVSNISKSYPVFASSFFDIVLFDLSIPGRNALKDLERLTYNYPHLPIVILSDIGDQDLSLAAIKSGAQDYIIKDQVNEHSLFKAIVFAIERKNIETELKYLADHDPLTGLPNRRLFSDRLQRGMKRFYRKTDQLSLGVLLLDLDSFKNVNDQYGHHVGDQVLSMIGKRLKHRLRQNDTVARLGGDEFVIILEGIMKEETGLFVAKSLLEKISEPIEINEHRIVVTGSIGVCYYPSHGNDVDVLLKKADLAMYRAKKTKEKVFLYSEL